MTAVLGSKTAKTGDLTPVAFPMPFLVGTPNGDAPAHVLFDSDGDLIDPATDESVQAAVTALGAILAKLGTKLSVSLDGDTVQLVLPAGIALDATNQAILNRLGQALTVNGSVSVANLPATQAVSGAVAISNLPATQPVSAGSLPLPAGAATEAGVDAVKAALQGTLTVGGSVAVSNLLAVQPVSATALPLPAGAATDASLQAIKVAVQAQIDLASTLWTDNSDAFYVRRDTVNEATGTITVAFTDPLGNTATPGAGLKPAASGTGGSGAANTRTVLQTLYDTTAAGTGITLGDVVGRVTVIDTSTSPPTLVVATWLNLTSGTVLASAPAANGIVEQTQHVAIANFPATQAVSAAALPLPAGAASEAGLEVLNATLGGSAQDTTLQAVKTALTGTLAVSAAALPLPAGAAADGSDITAATMPAGGAGIRGWLSAIWLKLGSLIVAPVTTAAVITPGTPVAPGRKVLINCTAQGNLRFKLSNGTLVDLAVGVGQSELDGYAFVDVVAASTTATATVTVLG